MVWRRIQDWRERRAALRDLKALQRSEQDHLAGMEVSPLHLAKAAADTGDLVAAAARWEDARLRLPEVIVESQDSLMILLTLRRFDEAEALMHARHARLFNDGYYLTGLALVAQGREEYAEATRRWKAVRNRNPIESDGYLYGGICARLLGNLDEAESLLRDAARLAPEDPRAWSEMAQVARLRGDWGAILETHTILAERFNMPGGYAGQARALLELGQAGDAEALLEGVAARFRNDPDIANTRAELADHLGDTDAAIDRWAAVRRTAPDRPWGYVNGARRLAERGRHAEADMVANQAIERFPAEAWPLIEHARLAHERGEWMEAAERWSLLRRLFSAEVAGYEQGAAALRAAGRETEADGLLPPP